MKKLSELERSNDIRYFETPDGKVKFPLNLRHITFETRVDLEREEYAEWKPGTRDCVECNFPTINELIADGRLLEKDYVEVCDLDTDSFSKRPNYKKWIQYFKERGFNVTKEALKHNFEAWYCDSKSGFRDEVNNYHLFTPCGCNPLSFRATRLDEHFEDWQITYGNYGW
jgi:hypothetical protein